MTGWPLITLADCCDIVSGATPKTSVEGYWDGEIDWVTPKDLSGLGGAYIHRTPRRITEAGLASCGASILPPKSVLFSSRAPIGHVAINTVPMATNQGFKSLIPDTKRVDAKYLFYWLRANRSYLEGLGNGATFKEVSKAIVSRVEIPVPPLDEQRRIAAILDTADALRAKRSQALAHLDDLTQSIFLDMFGDSSAANGHNWELKTIGAVADIQGGLTVNSARKTNPIEVPYLRVANVHRGRLELDEIKSFRVTEREIDRTRLQAGDLLVVEGHGNVDEIGRGALWDGSIDGCVHQNHLIRVRFDRRSVLPVYGSAFVNSQAGRRHLLRAGKTTSGLNTISVSDVRSTPIVTPPVRLQEAFVHRLDGIQSLQMLEKQAATDLDSLFASLQSRAFVGEL